MLQQLSQASNPVFDSKLERPPTALSDAIDRASNISEYAHSLANRLESMAHRLLGPEPTALNNAQASQSAPMPDPVSLVGKVECQHSNSFSALDRASRAIDRLESAI